MGECPKPDELASLLDGDEAIVRPEVRDHAKGCESCQKRLKDLEDFYWTAGAFIAMDTPDFPEAPRELVDRIVARVMGEIAPPQPPKSKVLKLAITFAVAAASLVAGVFLRPYVIGMPAPVSNEEPIASLWPIPITTQSGGDQSVEIQTSSHFVVGASFKLVVRSNKPGRVAVIVVDEQEVRTYQPEGTVKASEPFETGSLTSPLSRGAVFVFITPEPSRDALIREFPEDVGFKEEQLPEIRRRALKALAGQGYVVVEQVTVERRKKGQGP